MLGRARCVSEGLGLVHQHLHRAASLAGEACMQSCNFASMAHKSGSGRLLRLWGAEVSHVYARPWSAPSSVALTKLGLDILNRGIYTSVSNSAGAPLHAWLKWHTPAQIAWRGSVRLKSRMATADVAAAGAQASAAAAGHQAAAVVRIGGEALAAGVSPALRRQLQWWMAGTAGWVYTMVVLGGITRLTRSGLSMTDWKFTGERRPMNTEEWEAEFDKYRQSPEFKLIHSRMTLSEFKFIFWMEYAHRMWGRALGFAFALPCAYFVARGAINGPLAKRLGLLFFMGGTQGLVGWWMVRSGLQEPEHEWQQVRVSPYRLAGHLVSAFAIFATLTWTALDLGSPTPLTRTLTANAQAATARVRRYMLPFAALVAITATSGAFVAGMDAGHAYNEFPLMDGQLVPEQYWYLWEKGYKLRNFFENTAAVQFDHRALATTTATLALGLWAWIRTHPAGLLPRRAVLAADFVAAVTLAQWALGIWTLLDYVPVHLGSAHQANALNLFTAVLVTLHALRPASPGAGLRLASKIAAPVTMTAVAGVAWAVTAQQ